MSKCLNKCLKLSSYDFGRKCSKRVNVKVFQSDKCSKCCQVISVRRLISLSLEIQVQMQVHDESEGAEDTIEIRWNLG